MRAEFILKKTSKVNMYSIEVYLRSESTLARSIEMIGNLRANLIEFLLHVIDDLHELLADVESVAAQFVLHALKETGVDRRVVDWIDIGRCGGGSRR